LEWIWELQLSGGGGTPAQLLTLMYPGKLDVLNGSYCQLQIGVALKLTLIPSNNRNTLIFTRIIPSELTL
jgi:hypothetical protein